MIQLIEKQGKIFRVKINGIEHQWAGTMLWRDSLLPLPPKLKGSTLGWNTCGLFVSYWQ
jgi:hypothetical protein